MSDKTIKERLAMIEEKIENLIDDVKNYIARTDKRVTRIEDCKADKELVSNIANSVSKIKDDIKYFTRYAIATLLALVITLISFIGREALKRVFGG